MLVVVPVSEGVHALSCLTERSEARGKRRSVLQRLEQRLRVRVVVGHPWPRMRPGNLQISEQRGDGLAGHRGSPIGVHDLRYAMHREDLLHQFPCQNTGLVSMDVNTDEVAGIDVDHHVRIEISAPTASQMGVPPTQDGGRSPAKVTYRATALTRVWAFDKVRTVRPAASGALG